MTDPVEWNIETMAAYTGLYDDGRYSIFIDQNQLFWKYRPDVDFVVLPITEDLFAFDDTDDLRFNIIKNEAGAVAGFQLV